MVTQQLPRVDLDATGALTERELPEREAALPRRANPPADTGPGATEVPSPRVHGDRFHATRHGWFAQLHAVEYEPPFIR